MNKKVLAVLLVLFALIVLVAIGIGVKKVEVNGTPTPVAAACYYPQTNVGCVVDQDAPQGQYCKPFTSPSGTIGILTAVGCDDYGQQLLPSE